MINFLVGNLDSVIFIVIFAVICIIAIRYGYEKQIKQTLFYLVTRAEKTIKGRKLGELKFSAVSKWMYDKMPMIIRILFTEKQMETLIDNAVIYMKNYFAENSLHDVILGGDENV